MIFIFASLTIFAGLEDHCPARGRHLLENELETLVLSFFLFAICLHVIVKCRIIALIVDHESHTGRRKPPEVLSRAKGKTSEK